MDTGKGAMTASTAELLEGLNDLLQLNHDAIGAYEIAIEKLEDRDKANQISGFRLDHERHVRELTEAIEQLGGSPKNEPHATGPFKMGMQNLGAMAGDKGALLAFRTNELQVKTKYDNYAAKANRWPDDLKRMVDQHALDEERHYRWVTDELQRMGIGPREDMEIHAANKMREGVTRAQQAAGKVADQAREKVGMATDQAREKVGKATDQAREKVGMAAETARARVADGLERAAGRLDETANQQAGAGGAKARAADAAHRVADGMETTAGYIRTSDTEMLRRDIETQVRTSPLRSLLVTFGVGFVIGRILR